MDKNNINEQKCCGADDKAINKGKINEKKCTNQDNKEHETSCCHEHHGEEHHHEHSHHHHDGCGCGHDHEKGGGLATKQVLTYIIGALVLVVAFLGELGFLHFAATVVLSAAVYIFFGKEVWAGAYNSVRDKKFFTEFTLMCLATLGAICLGEFADAAAVIYLYSLGESVSGEAYSRSKKNIAQLIEISEENVTVIKDGNSKTVAASAVSVGEVISIRIGDSVALDGVVVEGNGFADTSAVTGESQPRELIRGSKCLSGSVLVSGAVYIKVEEKYENSTASKLKAAVERASKQKATTEKRISKFASVFTPIAFGVSVLIFIIGALTGKSIPNALRSALVVLVASCPCSLVLSVPLAYFSGIGRAAKKGIVFRGGQVIDNISSLGTAVFDKTGTLTESSPDFVNILLPKEPKIQKQVLLDICKAALLKSPHASARAFCEKYRSKSKHIVEDVKNVGGMGLLCRVDGMPAAFGNRKLMKELGVKAAPIDGSCIYVAIDGKLCGVLLFSAKLKKNALSQISALRREGVGRIAIMSGDNKAAVKDAAGKLGVGEFYSELKPDEKLTKLEHIYKEEKSANPKKSVAFFGDGLNDSAVIARADVGIAMGSGSSLTVESADVVILDDNLERIGDMMSIAKGTSSIVTQNIFLSLGIKIAVVLFGAFVTPSLELAVVADVGAAVITVLNAMRAGKI